LDGNYYEPDFEHLSKVMRDTYENYDLYKSKALEESKDIRENFNWSRVAEIGYEKLKLFKDKVSSPDYTSPSKIIENYINITYVNQPKVEITGDKKMDYLIEFVDGDTNEVVHSTKISNNMWVTCGRRYYTNWIIRINGKVHNRFNVERKRVLISLDSKSIGDTLAWAPYAVEFAKQNNCKVILSTFHNEWFINNPFYKDIEFIQPGQTTNCYASYLIGWFRDDKGGWEKYEMYPNQVNMIPLQQTATDILGLDYKEVNYGVNLKIGQRPIKEKYVVFGPQATAGCKEWVYEYWVELANMLKAKGYKVVILSSNPYKIDGTINVYGKSWDTVATYLWYSEFLVGLGSGLSWFNWALGKFTYMINGFVEEGHEFTKNMKKITKNRCIKCWNDPVHVFDAGDWDWCPVYKGTKLQHICQKDIKPIDVLRSIDFT
jgi:autotransporter strand-loop-strand O-heptosyltransferase